jgi:hypothetical protein
MRFLLGWKLDFQTFPMIYGTPSNLLNKIEPFILSWALMLSADYEKNRPCLTLISWVIDLSLFCATTLV